MKIAGIILLVLGIMSTLGAIIGTANGQSISFGGIGFIVLGAFLISRANKKNEDEKKKKEWLEGKSE
jgi:hypothetical protein